ncbi:hypothetical protein [Legionella sp. PC997]|uniref:hypothetical protein n=1 Tax=Legionella sp. PC997 TaxID=2755562 RepID=UPI0015FD1F4F|nr:hypothetical protein [Legionella sp. PC997]QMT60526.1 hypothetical protein HBNCFIEN_01899 [Legionella sp. PC997]
MRNREESDGITPSINLSKSVLIIDLQKKIASLHMSEREKVLEEFWHRIENGKGSPLIEKNESGDYTVTFLYRSKEEVIVELDCNDLNEHKLDKDGKVRLFDRIPDTDIYLFTIENMPGEVIVPYGFTVNKQDVQDMLNKNTFHLPLCNLGNGETFLDIRNSSVLALPNANRDLNWYKGNIVKEQGNLYPQDIEDKKQGFGERRLWIYTPPDFNVKRKEPYKLMVITDGGTYAMIMKPHLDQQQVINPILRNTVVAFVGNVREGSVNYHPINLVENETNDDAEHRQYEFLEHSDAFYEAVIAPTIETLNMTHHFT